MFLEKTLSALSDPNRIKIIDALKKRDMNVSEILNFIPVTMPTLSHHLDILKRADLVTSRRNGQNIIYSLNISIIDEAAEAIMKLLTTRR